jgi:hypothetical protein
MKRSCLVFLFLLYSVAAAHADFVSGSTGADGAFNPATNAVLQLPPSGVFNFTTVNIPSGVTVTFTKNAANTPVVILATGNITISGAIKVDGQTVVASNPVGTAPGAGGPGGYGGGYGGTSYMAGGKGMGPGGGGGGQVSASYFVGGGGGFATAGGTYSSGCGAGGPAYGAARLIPLVGGSGGGGAGSYSTASSYGGGGGGGAILIASSTTITINSTGSITANGGDGYNYSGGGSGGGIRLIGNTITGAGLISAKGGSLGYNYRGGQGRIRIEAYTNSYTPGTDPPYTYGQPGGVFPSNIPSLAITSIAGVSAPATPTGSYATPDVLLPNTTTNPVAVNISAANIPAGTTVAVTVTPQYGSSSTVNTTLSGTDTSSAASANVTLSTQYSNVITAQATFTLLASMYYENEKIAKVRVTTTTGKESHAVYITESGKEIPVAVLLVKAGR